MEYACSAAKYRDSGKKSSLQSGLNIFKTLEILGDSFASILWNGHQRLGWHGCPGVRKTWYSFPVLTRSWPLGNFEDSKNSELIFLWFLSAMSTVHLRVPVCNRVRQTQSNSNDSSQAYGNKVKLSLQYFFPPSKTTDVLPKLSGYPMYEILMSRLWWGKTFRDLAKKGNVLELLDHLIKTLGKDSWQSCLNRTVKISLTKSSSKGY